MYIHTKYNSMIIFTLHQNILQEVYEKKKLFCNDRLKKFINEICCPVFCKSLKEN